MDIADVRKVANLARLSLTEEELESSRQQLGAILDYVRLLDEVNLEGVSPMPHPVPMSNVFREDVQQSSLSREDSLANACKTDGQFFLVPRILEEKG
ncbi:MAG: Asp-tRNA(Asn)/Glu-tRNA(Gln) amidotransferase subunit GatC [Planctomycetaceae bacterium]